MWGLFQVQVITCAVDLNARSGSRSYFTSLEIKYLLDKEIFFEYDYHVVKLELTLIPLFNSTQSLVLLLINIKIGICNITTTQWKVKENFVCWYIHIDFLRSRFYGGSHHELQFVLAHMLEWVVR